MGTDKTIFEEDAEDLTLLAFLVHDVIKHFPVLFSRNFFLALRVTSFPVKTPEKTERKHGWACAHPREPLRARSVTSKSNRKMVEKDKIDTANTQILDRYFPDLVQAFP
jgi:hypothetical protein